MTAKPHRLQFALDGSIEPLAKASVVSGAHVPTRPLGGWIATYGKIRDDGTVVPTTDRQGHVFEAARVVGAIDFAPYLAKGLWDDTHDKLYIGRPRVLEHHDGTTPLSKAHRKVGWWTEGHLWDRKDPQSWTDYTEHVPTPRELDRADFYWDLATLLKGSPRSLGFSAEGDMLLSRCKTRIIWAQVRHNAVCQIPQNPDATAIPLRLSTDERLDLGHLVADPCAGCTCPTGARCRTREPIAELRKAVDRGRLAGAGIVDQGATSPDAEGLQDPDANDMTADDVAEAIALVQSYFRVGKDVATKWVRDFMEKNRANATNEKE